MLRKSKQIAIQTLKIAFAGAIIFWLIQSGKLNFSAVFNLFLSPWILPATLLVFTNIFICGERWRYLLQTQGLRPRVGSVFQLNFIGLFFNFAMPGGVGGDIVKAFYFTKDYPGSGVVAVTSVLIDRVLGLYSMIVMALFVMCFDYSHVVTISALHKLFYLVLALFLSFSLALALLFSQKLYDHGGLKRIIARLPLAEKFHKLYESFHLYGKDGKRIFFCIALSILAQTCTILFLSIAGMSAQSLDLPLKTYFLVAPLGFMATAIPISPAGVGVGQAAFYYLFNIYSGQNSDLGPTTITAFQVLTFVLSLVGAFFYLRRKEKLPDQIETA